jgi:hypothetical protein
MKMKKRISDDSNNSRRAGLEKWRHTRAHYVLKNKRILKIRLVVLIVSLLGVLVSYFSLCYGLKRINEVHSS